MAAIKALACPAQAEYDEEDYRYTVFPWSSTSPPAMKGNIGASQEVETVEEDGEVKLRYEGRTYAVQWVDKVPKIPRHRAGRPVPRDGYEQMVAPKAGQK